MATYPPETAEVFAAAPSTLSRALTVGFAVQYAVSMGILLAASLGLAGSPPPISSGVVDVILVFTLLATVARLHRLVPAAARARALPVAYRGAGMLIATGLAVIWAASDYLDLNVLLPGLAWRSWMLLWALPSLLGAWHREG